MSKVGDLRAALRELLDEHNRDGTIPTSGRFLFYELVSRGIISREKKQGPGRRPDQDMTDALVDLRESGEIPWEWIIDETRSLESFVNPDSIEKYVLACLSGARLDPWNGEHPLILTRADRWREYCATNAESTEYASQRLTVNAADFCTLPLHLSYWSSVQKSLLDLTGAFSTLATSI
jgi:hypothetical protein